MYRTFRVRGRNFIAVSTLMVILVACSDGAQTISSDCSDTDSAPDPIGIDGGAGAGSCSYDEDCGEDDPYDCGDLTCVDGTCAFKLYAHSTPCGTASDPGSCVANVCAPSGRAPQCTVIPDTDEFFGEYTAECTGQVGGRITPATCSESPIDGSCRPISTEHSPPGAHCCCTPGSTDKCDRWFE